VIVICPSPQLSQSYEDQVGRPILTCLELDSTLPPCCPENNVRGKLSIKRLQGLGERNFQPLPGVGKKRTRKGDNPHKKTAKNIADMSLSAALLQDSSEPERTLRVAAVHVEEEESEKEDEISAEQREVEMLGELSALGW